MYSVFLREWRRLLTRPLYIFCMLAVPLFCVVFFTTLMDSGLPADMPIGLVDLDNSATTRNIARNLDAFQNTRIVERYADFSAARRAMQRGEIYAFYYIPEGTTRRLLRGEAPLVSFYTNNTFLMAGSLLYKDLRTMTELAAGAASRSVLLAHGTDNARLMGMLQPILVDLNAVGNPSLNYNVYLSNVLGPGMLSLMVFFITVFSIGQEIKDGSGARLLRLARGSALRALLGKLGAQSLVFLLVGAAIGLYLYGYLAFPCRGGIWLQLSQLGLLVFASQGFGVAMICALPSPRLGLSFASLVGVLSFSICGMSFPVMAMHPVLQGISALFPLRHYFLIYVNSALDGHPLSAVALHVAALGAFALLPLALGPRFRTLMTRIAYDP